VDIFVEKKNPAPDKLEPENQGRRGAAIKRNRINIGSFPLFINQVAYAIQKKNPPPGEVSTAGGVEPIPRKDAEEK
jgi:hypothetical protein